MLDNNMIWHVGIRQRVMRYNRCDIYNRLRYDAIDKDYHNARKETKRNEDKVI